ncbi:MAG: RNA-binding protein [Acidobacteria bacterium]|nr:RNA-binding protein [Acidobacteriota bacterium]
MINSMNRTTSLAAALLFATLPLAAQTTPASDAPKPAGIDATVSAIQSLENVRDPKCDATATRLENFMYGTPLSTEAREKKVELQKKLISGVWKQASDEARAKKLDAIPADVIQPIILATFPFTIDADKNAHVKLADGSELLLAERDVRQYSTVAYALRAILATQQDALLTPDVKLVPLANDAVPLMKQMIDVYTLAALNLSDKAARKSGEHQLSAGTLAAQWTRIVPGTAAGTAAKAPVLKPAASEQKAGEVLRKIIDQKLVSFATYNSNANPLLYSNIQTFYARYPWPTDDAQIAGITQAFAGGVMDFIAETIVRAEQKARAENSPVVREKHIRQVFNEFAPYTVNVYEDVIFFDRLPKDKQVYIEAYDADSLRDSGLHWAFIKQVIDSRSFPLQLDLDPFAAELLAEGDAQMGVLLFRTAGQIAKAQNAPALTAEHIELARKQIKQRFTEQLAAPAPSKAPAAKLASASQKTPIAGGRFFADATDRSGIDFSHYSSDWLARYQRSFLYSLNAAKNPNQPAQQITTDIPPAFSGSGVAAEDINGDGFPDVLLVGGRGNKLYLGNGDGTFRDVTAKAGISWTGPDGQPGEPRQPMIVDLDNDGLNDIVITYVNAPHRVYRNLGDGTFQDVTDVAKLGGENLVGGPAVAFDFDRDGLLDLYIGYYGDYLHGVGPNLARVNTNGTPNKLFKNMGNFHFKDVSEGSGTENTGWTQAAASVDFDRDGWPDLIVGNDFGKNAYYRNLGNGRFEDVSAQLGTDLPSSSMNVGSADLNKDGYPDIYISNIVGMVKDEKYVMPTEETKMKRLPAKLATMRVFENNHLFTSTSKYEKGKLPKYALNEAVDPMDTSTGWAWDADFFDFDNDGDDDLYVVNGLNEYRIYADTFKTQTAEGERTIQFAVHEKEPNVFFVNENGRLINRSTESGADFSGNSRAAAYLDFDNDGDLDVVVNNYDSKATFLVNNSEKLKNNWLKVKLVGDPSKQTNPQAIGATIIATTPSGNRIWREVQSATGYLSQHPSKQHLGLGKDTEADLTVTWPNGETKEYKHVKAGKVTTLKQ